MKNKKKYLFVILLVIFIIIVVKKNIIKVPEVKKDNSETQKIAKDNKYSSEKDQKDTSEKKQEYVYEITDGIKFNKSSKLIEEKKLGNFVINNIQLTSQDGVTTLIADVKNTGEKNDTKSINIQFLDEQNKIIKTAKGIINPMDTNETTKLNISISSDYVDAYNINIIYE